MRLLLRVLSVLLVESFFGSLVVVDCRSSQEVHTPPDANHCGPNEICVPDYLCNGGRIKLQDQPQLSPRSELVECGPKSQCCLIENQPFINYNCSAPQLAFDVPYYALLSSKNFVVGKSIRAEVRVKLDPQEFVISLQSGQNVWPLPTTAFHLNVSQANNNTIEVNTISNGTWGEEEKWKWDPNLNGEKSFRLDIVRRAASFDVHVNGKLLGKFAHRVNPDIVDTFHVSGDVRLGKVVLETYTPTEIMQESIYRDHDGETPLHTYTNLGEMKEGVSFTFTGYILPICEKFAINLLSETNNVFHFNPRFDDNEIVLNSQVLDGDWDDEELSGFPSSLRRNATFTVQILVIEDYFFVAVNGRHWSEFKHRYPYKSVSSITVVGDVDNVQYKRTENSKYPQPTPESEELSEIEVVS